MRRLSEYYQRKRDLFLDRLRDSRFSWTPAAGTYFQLLDYSAISDEDDVAFADRLLRTAGVASIPVSPFYDAAAEVARPAFLLREERLHAGGGGGAAAQRLGIHWPQKRRKRRKKRWR